VEPVGRGRACCGPGDGDGDGDDGDGRWTRAEPGFRHKTPQEVKEWLASREAEYEAEQAERERQRRARAAEYDERRHQARLALVEQQSILNAQVAERTGLQERTRFPGMEDSRSGKE
jgi:hypothetical protein